MPSTLNLSTTRRGVNGVAILILRVNVARIVQLVYFLKQAPVQRNLTPKVEWIEKSCNIRQVGFVYSAAPALRAALR